MLVFSKAGEHFLFSKTKGVTNMIKKTITFTDYNGTERTEEFWFNLTKAEVLEMELTTKGGMEAYIKKIVSTQDIPSLIEYFKTLILKSYGEKSADGRRFIKNKQLTEEFTQTEAYSILFMELATNADAAAEFVNGIIPSDIDMNDPAVQKEVDEIRKLVPVVPEENA